MSETISFRAIVTDAIRYWEVRRLLYNFILAGIVVCNFAFHWPGSRQALQVTSLLLLFILAIVANVAYCAAYAVDLFAQSSTLRERWLGFRWILLLIGIAFASALAYFWSFAFVQGA